MQAARQAERQFGYGQVRRVNLRQTVKSDNEPIVSPKDKGRLLMGVIAAGIICVMLIIMSALSASLQYDINKLTEENNKLEGQIAEENVILQTKYSITELEKMAKSNLGMVYPKESQIVYVDEIAPAGDFEATAIEQAYN